MNMDSRGYAEIVERCLSIMVYYHNAGRSDESTRLMEREVRAVAERLDLASRAAEEEYRVHLPVRDGLVSRYGHELGPRLFSEFSRAFEGHAVTA